MAATTRTLSLVALACLILNACSDPGSPATGGDPLDPSDNPIDLPGGSLTLCDNPVLRFSTWYGYRNEGGEWTSIAPDEEGRISFMPTTRVSFAKIGSNAVDVWNVLASELTLATGLECRAKSTSFVTGSLAGVAYPNFAYTYAGQSYSYGHSTLAWRIDNLSVKPVDLVAIGTPFGSAQSRVIVRRGITPVGQDLGVLNFSGPEAVDLVTAPLTYAGIPAGHEVSGVAELHTANGTVGRVVGRSTLPASAAVAGDTYVLRVSTGSPALPRVVVGIEDFYTEAQPTTITFGPIPSVPSTSAIEANPFRVRVNVPFQPEYAGGVQVQFSESCQRCNGVIRMLVTAGFQSDAPANGWSLETPNFGAAGTDVTDDVHRIELYQGGPSLKAFSHIPGGMHPTGTLVRWGAR